MKSNELMIGDWVIHTQTIDRYLNILEEPIKVYARVESILEDGINQDNCQGCDDYVEIESVDPIPLTEEILKANGFEWYSHEYVYWQDEDGREPPFRIFRNSQGVLRISVAYKLVRLRYVHELQHALRLCGLSDLANNFKI